MIYSLNSYCYCPKIDKHDWKFVVLVTLMNLKIEITLLFVRSYVKVYDSQIVGNQNSFIELHDHIELLLFLSVKIILQV